MAIKTYPIFILSFLATCAHALDKLSYSCQDTVFQQFVNSNPILNNDINIPKTNKKQHTTKNIEIKI